MSILMPAVYSKQGYMKIGVKIEVCESKLKNKNLTQAFLINR